jgi:hypothetical protein
MEVGNKCKVEGLWRLIGDRGLDRKSRFRAWHLRGRQPRWGSFIKGLRAIRAPALLLALNLNVPLPLNLRLKRRFQNNRSPTRQLLTRTNQISLKKPLARSLNNLRKPCHLPLWSMKFLRSIWNNSKETYNFKSRWCSWPCRISHLEGNRTGLSNVRLQRAQGRPLTPSLSLRVQVLSRRNLRKLRKVTLWVGITRWRTTGARWPCSRAETRNKAGNWTWRTSTGGPKLVQPTTKPPQSKRAKSTSTSPTRRHPPLLRTGETTSVSS